MCLYKHSDPERGWSLLLGGTAKIQRGKGTWPKQLRRLAEQPGAEGRHRGMGDAARANISQVTSQPRWPNHGFLSIPGLCCNSLGVYTREAHLREGRANGTKHKSYKINVHKDRAPVLMQASVITSKLPLWCACGCTQVFSLSASHRHAS